MPIKRQIAYPLLFCLLLILSSVGLLFLISNILPGFLEAKIISIVKKDAGLTDFALDLNELDLEGASLGSVRIGPPQNPALVIHSLHIAYSLRGIYQKQIQKITASGVELFCEYKNGQLGFGNLNFDQVLSRLQSIQSKGAGPVDGPALSFPERIQIRNGTLIGRINGKSDRIPFEIDGVRAEGDSTALQCTVRMYPRGQLFETLAHIDLEKKRVSLQATTDNLELLRFADIIEGVEGLNISGFIHLELKVDLQLAPFMVFSTAARLQADPISISYKNFQYRSHANHSNKQNPLIIDIAGSGLEKWNIKLSDIGPVAPLAAAASGIEATMQRSANAYAFFGNVNLLLGTAAVSPARSVPLIFEQPLELPLKFSTRLTKTGNWQFDLSSREQRQPGIRSASLLYGQTRITTKIPEVHLTGNAMAGKVKSAYSLHLPDVRITSDVVDIFLPRFVLKGKTDFSRDSPKALLSILDLDLSGAALKMNASQIKLNDLTAGATWQTDQRGLQEIAGIVRFANTNLDSANGSLRLRQAKGTLPLKFPAGNTANKGGLTIAAVGYQKLNLGAIEGQIQQTAAGLSFSGNLKSQLLPQLIAKFSGNADFWGAKAPETRVDFELLYPETGPEFDLGRLLPAAAGFTFEGKFFESGNLVVTKNGMTAAAETTLSKGKLLHRDYKIEIEDIGMSLIISDLLGMRSAPGQQLRIGRAAIGGLNIENGEIVFQIESARSLLIEKSRFNWCDGSVDAPAIRLRPGVEDYSLILYCDRLNLAKVLEQFGAARVEANGQLNGKIPLRYQNGQLSFQDGFLFTTPGESGKIRMTNTEILTAGIPPDSPQYVQMELARKALEDYDYSWAKLNLTTEGEDLLLKMQLDGKPGKSLPFVYRKDLGGFAQVEADFQGSTFQGIRLDVNFRLPLNKIMQYKELIQMLQKSRE
jgi:Dicarboxylate transport